MVEIDEVKLCLGKDHGKRLPSNDILAKVSLNFTLEDVNHTTGYQLYLFLFRVCTNMKNLERIPLEDKKLLAFGAVPLVAKGRKMSIHYEFKDVLPQDNTLGGIQIAAQVFPDLESELKLSNTYFFNVLLK